jgi:flagellar protein FliO/FliZ
MSLPSSVKAIAFALVTYFLLAPAALAEKASKAALPPQDDYGDNKPLNLPLEQTQQADPTGASGGGSLVRTFVGLAIVVAVIYGLYWVLRQVKSSREERVSGQGLASQAVVPLGPGRSLHLVKAGRELVLVGVAEHGVTPIRTYSESEAAQLGLIGGDDDHHDDFTPAAPSAPRQGPMTIGDLLQKLREKTVRA